VFKANTETVNTFLNCPRVSYQSNPGEFSSDWIYFGILSHQMSPVQGALNESLHKGYISLVLHNVYLWLSSEAASDSIIQLSVWIMETFLHKHRTRVLIHNQKRENCLLLLSIQI